MRGVILAGGRGTRMLPATKIINKHLLTVLNKPMILYPIETLKTLGITEIMVVTGGNHIGGIAEFLGDGSEYGVDLTYRVQKEAGGIAEALGLAKDFANCNDVAVVLGDNIFENGELEIFNGMRKLGKIKDKCFLFTKEVEDPQRFGVFYMDKEGMHIEEKPKNPKSNRAVTGLYIYPYEVFRVIPTLKPSKRGELEITDVNNHFIKEEKVSVINLSGFWSDAGTPESLKKVIDWEYGTK
jgi:glucose-1-phosphate thymidylyltransferase